MAMKCWLVDSLHKTAVMEKWYLSHDIDGLVQERHNSIANALELCLYRTNPWHYMTFTFRYQAVTHYTPGAPITNMV